MNIPILPPLTRQAIDNLCGAIRHFCYDYLTDRKWGERTRHMRDLKYLNYFEKLLQEANNELIVKAKEDGKICVSYTCENVPEPLLNLGDCVSIRLSAPNTGSLDIATYYMTNLLCEPSRALLERAIEGGFNFSDCVITPDGCTMINRAVENMELLETMGKGNPKFFHEYMEIAFKNTENDVNLAVLQCKNHILKPLHENYGVDTSDAAIREAVERHNRLCRVIREIGEFRKEEKPRITGYEFHVLCLATYVCPKYLVLDKLEERPASRTTDPGAQESCWSAPRWTTPASSSSSRSRAPSSAATASASAPTPAAPRSSSMTRKMPSRRSAATTSKTASVRA